MKEDNTRYAPLGTNEEKKKKEKKKKHLDESKSFPFRSKQETTKRK
jgi:hypothetical protein